MLTSQSGDIFAENYRHIRLIDTGEADLWQAIFLSAGSHLLIARYFGKQNGYPFLEMGYCPGGNERRGPPPHALPGRPYLPNEKMFISKNDNIAFFYADGFDHFDKCGLQLAGVLQNPSSINPV